MFSYVFCPNFQTSVVMSKLPISLLFHGATPQNCLLFSLNPKNCKSHGGHSSDGYYESMLPVTLQMRTHSSSRPTPDDRPENHVLLPFLPQLNPPDKLRPLYITSNSVPRPDLLHLPKSVSPPVPYTRPLLTYLLTYSSDLRIPFQHLAFKRPQSLPVPSSTNRTPAEPVQSPQTFYLLFRYERTLQIPPPFKTSHPKVRFTHSSVFPDTRQSKTFPPKKSLHLTTSNS
jgi:hypothetical protein